VCDVDGSRLVEWAVAARPRRGETVCGDDSVVTETADGLFVAVVDGLGHGRDAAHAAGIAVRTAGDRAHDGLTAVVGACHEALRHSRGAAIGVAAVSAVDATMTWLGIGNVGGTLSRGMPAIPLRHVSLPLSEGVVGWRLPVLQPTKVEIERGDVLVVATDGVTPGVADSAPLVGSTSAIAERLIGHDNRDDDALVLVLRYLGPSR
jgi:phosphoserine phosphatase RsbX